MDRKVINPPTVHKPVSHYSHAVVVGNMVWVTGQIAIDKNGNTVGKGDCVAQAHQVYQNLRDVLQGVGSGMDKVVKLNTYIVDVEDAARIRGIKSQYIKKDPPASTMVIVKALAYPDLLIEMEAVAVVG